MILSFFFSPSDTARNGLMRAYWVLTEAFGSEAAAVSNHSVFGFVVFVFEMFFCDRLLDRLQIYTVKVSSFLRSSNFQSIFYFSRIGFSTLICN